MDAIPLGQFISGLDSETVERITAEELTPGCVIATGPWKKHVVVEMPKRLNSHTTTLVLALRHLGGGHTVRPYYPGGHSVVRVYGKRLPEPLLEAVPFVPPCVIPEEPAVGDRLVMHWHTEGHRPHVHEWDGEHWCTLYTTEDGSQVARYSTLSIRAFVRLTDTPSQFGWYVYEPANTA